MATTASLDIQSIGSSAGKVGKNLGKSADGVVGGVVIFGEVTFKVIVNVVLIVMWLVLVMLMWRH